MNAVEQLLAIEDIKRLKARYFRLSDTKRWDELGEVFSERAILDMRAATIVGPQADDEIDWRSPPDGCLVGRPAIMEAMRTIGGRMLSVHHGHMPEITVESDHHAKGIWAMEDLVQWPKGAGPVNSLHGFGYYHDRYVKGPSGWKIDYSALTRLRVETT
jgi:hypothetical protein